MSPKKLNNYELLKKFALENKDKMSRTKILEEFRKANGEGVQKQKGLNFLADLFEENKIPVTRKNKQNKSVRSPAKRTYLKKNLKSYLYYNNLYRDCKDLNSPAIQLLYRNIKKLYPALEGVNNREFISIRCEVAGDLYTQDRYFHFFIPVDFQDNSISYKEFAEKLIFCIRKYYQRLSKRYNDSDLKQVDNNIRFLENKISDRKRFNNFESLFNLMNNHGFKMTEVTKFEFTRN